MPRLDKGLAVSLALGAILRILPIEEWSRRPCVRDECTYGDLASSLWRGQGMVGTRGWLWAPGYPSTIAAHVKVFGHMKDVKYTQVAIACLTIWLVWRFTRAHFGARAAFIAAMLLAVNPTHIFYASSLWSECFYTALLFGMVSVLGWARGESPGSEGGSSPPHWSRGLGVGLLLGACVLYRGVATYLLPCVAVTLLWGRYAQAAAWKSVLATTAAAALVVAPYSAYATKKFGGFVLSDRTLGQMMWLGNNDFPPITFDYGNGIVDDREFDRVTATGREHCPFELEPTRQDACEMDAGVAWVRSHPAEFLARVPVRVSQMLTPHSLLTRNLRTGRWKGMPQAVDEALIVAVAALSFVVLVGGTIGAFARGRGWYVVGATLIVGYHIAAIACLAGLSRYRVPLEPLWMVFAAGFLAEPRASFSALMADKRRLWGAVVVTSLLVVVMLRFLPAGWRSWGSWW